MPSPRTRSPQRSHAAVTALVALLSFFSVAACTSKVDDVAPTTAAGDAAPEFTGPWAADFAETYDYFDDEFSHAALADSAISDMEFQEGMAIIRECYAAAGFSVEYDQYGYETVTSLDGTGDPMEIMGTCAFADGGVSVLYYQIKGNPENVALETLIAECLVRVGVVEPGFTGQEFTEVTDSQEVPWSPGDERVEPCMKDPLGLLAGTGE